MKSEGNLQQRTLTPSWVGICRGLSRSAAIPGPSEQSAHVQVAIREIPPAA